MALIAVQMKNGAVIEPKFFLFFSVPKPDHYTASCCSVRGNYEDVDPVILPVILNLFCTQPVQAAEV